MIRLGVTAAFFVTLSVLTGCQTNKATYKDAFDQAGKRNDPKAQAEMKKELEEQKKTAAWAEPRRAHLDDPAPLSAYRLEDLSPGHRPSIETDEAGLWMTMDRSEQRLKTSGRLIKDPALNAYVRDLTCRLAGPHCKDIRVYILRIPYFNATMAPNGVMQVWSGALLRLRNEAQLATILSHEIGHYLRRHSLQRYRDIVNKSGALVVLQFAAALAGAPGAGDIAALALLASIQSYNRDQEREADGYGLRLMYEQSYDPGEAHELWSRILKESDADKDKKAPDPFFASHPPSVERRDALKDIATKLSGEKDWLVNREAYVAAVSPFWQQFLRDELKLGKFDRSMALLETLAEDGMEPGLTGFFKGELYRLRNGDGDYASALMAYEEALNSGQPPAELHRSMGLVLRKLKRVEDARGAFSKYLLLKPDAKDAEFIRMFIDGENS